MKKLSNKILIITLVVLIGIFVLSRIFRSPSLESNLRKDLVQVDTSQVTEVRIQPAKEPTKELKLIKKGNKWRIIGDAREADAEAGTVESMLGVIKKLEAQRMVTRKKDKWETFEVGEASSRVMVFAGGDKQADFRVGKTGFNQGQGGGLSGAYTYVRLTNEDEVYSSEGFIGSHFNRTFTEWRNKAFLKITRDDVTKIQFNYPDSSFVLEKRDSVWFAGDALANESKVTQYFSKIRFKNVSDFEDGFVQPGKSLLTLQIHGNGGPIATAQAWKKNEDEWVLTSTLQDGVYFLGKTSDVIKDIFPGRDWFTNP